MIALALTILTVITVFALSVFLANPFTGSIYDIGDTPNVNMVMSNDDGVESGIAGDWDQTDDGMDPSGLHPSSVPFIVTRHGYDIQNCTAVINGDHIDVTMTDAHDTTYCALWLRVNGDSTTEVFEYVQAVITGTDQIEIVEEPACGSISIPIGGSVPGVTLQLTTSGTAVPGTTWDGASASIDIEWGVAGSYTCP